MLQPSSPSLSSLHYRIVHDNFINVEFAIIIQLKPKNNHNFGGYAPMWLRFIELLIQLGNSAFHPSGVGKSSPGLWLGLRQVVFTCIGGRCDPIW